MAVLTRASDSSTSPTWTPFKESGCPWRDPRRPACSIAGTRFTIEFIGGDLYMGTFKLVSGQKSEPRHMDMLIEEGPPEHAGRPSLCIYQLDGGVLRWCPGRPGTTRRPAAFPDVDDPRFLSLVFRRVRPTNRR